MKRVDIPALQFVIVLFINFIVGFVDSNFDPNLLIAGVLMTLSSVLLFTYAVVYLRRGFFGNTEPVLELLITKGPYKFCRHPLYLSFLFLLFGFGILLGSRISIIFTLLFSVPSAIYRAKKEDIHLKSKFGESWEHYSSKVGLFYPKLLSRIFNTDM
jgi:protein-S-isoprenylcysteine O-methyltransferase Ste14